MENYFLDFEWEIFLEGVVIIIKSLFNDILVNLKIRLKMGVRKLENVFKMFLEYIFFIKKVKLIYKI